MWILDTSEFVPRWICGNWPDWLAWTYILSNFGIWLAYISIPLMMYRLHKKRPDIPFRGVWLVFILFIVSCGFTHLLQGIVFWKPVYRLATLLDLFTAVISLTAAVMLWRAAPFVISFKSPDQLEDMVTARTQELEEANRQKSDFLALLSHELRNPLAPIHSCVSVLGNTSDPDIIEEARRVLDRQVGHLTRLVDDLLDIARIEKGKINLKKHNVNIVDLMALSIETYRSMFEQKNQCLYVDMPREPIVVFGDHDRLQQVLLNLLTNANKYTPVGCPIWVKVTDLKGQVVVSIKDSGPGIKPKHLPHMFEKFFQGDRATFSGGLGLGLAISKGLIEMHSGTIDVKSELGEGTEFIIVLPTSSVVEDKKDTDIVYPTPPTTIMIVDDNKDAAEMMAADLRLADHTVHCAFSAQMALDMLRRFPVEFVFLDIGMPEMDGYQAIHEIRKFLPNQKIIALTGWGDANARRRTKEAGFDDHLIKPVTSASLERVIERFQRQRQ